MSQYWDSFGQFLVKFLVKNTRIGREYERKNALFSRVSARRAFIKAGSNPVTSTIKKPYFRGFFLFLGQFLVKFLKSIIKSLHKCDANLIRHDLIGADYLVAIHTICVHVDGMTHYCLQGLFWKRLCHETDERVA